MGWLACSKFLPMFPCCSARNEDAKPAPFYSLVFKFGCQLIHQVHVGERDILVALSLPIVRIVYIVPCVVCPKNIDHAYDTNKLGTAASFWNLCSFIPEESFWKITFS